MDRQQTPLEEIKVITAPSFGVRQEVVRLSIAEVTEHSPQEALKSALLRPREQAHELGADAIVSLTYSVTERSLSGGVIKYYGIATGTAVLLPWPAGHGDPLLACQDQE